jgi:hypothetical protein
MNEPTTTLVVARYNEDLEWITGVPEHFHVIIYNKGGLIESLSALRRADVIEERSNVGRESETYFAHMLAHGDSGREWTIFCQGDPFEHSPDFLELLKRQDQWRPVQPLSLRWLADKAEPPPLLIGSETADWIDGCRVRRENFSLFSLSAAKFVDFGMTHICGSYLKVHGLEPGTNLAAHFLRMAGLDDLASQADEADFGEFCYGAIFAVQRGKLAGLPPASLEKLLRLTEGDGAHGYVCERLWLHFFGVPFLKLEPSRPQLS